MADEVAAQTYAANDLSRAFLQPGIADAVKHGCDIVNPIFAKLPVYLQNIGFKEPDSYVMGPHSFTYGRPLWEHLEAEPRRSKIFDKVMMAFKQNRENFVDIFPWAKETQLQLPEDEVFFVDVAGGIGHRAKDLKTRYPSLPGRVILQDLPHVLPSSTLEPEVLAGLQGCGIELMPHDIFTPQVVIGLLP
ncbi:hypothetical protein ONS95_005129 [Cadophora gregata]|uniref:uncharacterized protein n=1 Tax=Cadophora gregata TaxID=51156 RepID=UPI0026DD442D|nr:uncharacterized protein ONS95_005129 [Cadophora gregata]KAK0104863.1 hypothetical protein ONS95_005129 [Cadophora gregata]KAK0115058.1 hypothetical protein ONS96_013528 [Cadophora gregata f. sp. sojae]